MSITVVPVKLSDVYERADGPVVMTGIKALVRMLFDRHRIDAANGFNSAIFVSGYEGSPLGGFDLELERQRSSLDAANVVFVPGLNEEAAATAVQGSQLAQTLEGQRFDGVTGFWYGKAPGLDRATDALRHANLMGTAPTGGAVALVGDDPGAKSSSVPCASDGALAELAIPYLYPADAQEVLDLGVHAVEMSRVSGLWTALKIVTAVADGACTVELSPSVQTPDEPAGGRQHRPTAKLLQPALDAIERDFVTHRLELARQYGELNRLNRVTVRSDADRFGIAAPGKTYADLRAALVVLGVTDDELRAAGIRLMKISMPYPISSGSVREFADGLDHVLVLEEKRAFIENAFKEALYGIFGAPRITGKTDEVGAVAVPCHGELDADALLPVIARHLADWGLPHGTRWLEQRKDAASVAGRLHLPLLSRAPYFCSGCPHNSSTKLATDSLVGAGIGCHAMVLLMDEKQVGRVTGLTQMGGEGTQWIGMAPFLESGHFVQNVGDGTFHHSASLAVRALVASGRNITYKLLHNSAVAMTGGQHAVGAMSVPNIVRSLLADGVSRIIVTTEDRRRYRRVRMPAGVEVWDRSRLAEAQRVLAAVPGVTVLIHDQECAAEKRRKRKRKKLDTPPSRVVINERICEGCGDCGQKSNCLSVQPVDTEFGRKTRIDQASCNLDYSCIEGDCPAFMVTGTTTAPRKRLDTPQLEAVDLPSPTRVVGADDFSLRLAGVGGTGVVTVSQVLAVAAGMDGRFVRTLDQTGLAQKGGSVVSDVRVFTDPCDVAAKISAGRCDLYLALDVLTAAASDNLKVLSRTRTTAVLSAARVPTGHMVSDPSVAFPGDDETFGRIEGAAKPGSTLTIDARHLAERLFGDDQYANMVVVGAAYQLGALPISAESIESAIVLNGAAVAANIQAFRRGRQFVADRRGLDADLNGESGGTTPTATDGPTDTAATVSRRFNELVRYQSEQYAQLYLERVNDVALTERALGRGTAISDAYARNLFKLMAYKDEYEIARLALESSPDFLAGEFGDGVSYAWKLQPPILKAFGLKKKITVGRWFVPVFRALYSLRRLRGSALDVFGYAAVRRIERELIPEYVAAVRESLRTAGASERYEVIAEIARLPDMVRGFEEVKLRNVEAYRKRLADLMTASSAMSHLRPLVVSLSETPGWSSDAGQGSVKNTASSAESGA